MTHTPNPIYENKSGRTSLSLVFTILTTGGLFLIIPLTQLSSEEKEPEDEKDRQRIFMTPPPLPVDIPEPPDKDDEQEDPPPEMDPTFQQLTLTQINGLFLESTGGAKQFVSGFNENDFPIADPIFDSAELDVAPKAILTAAPTYPPALKRARIEGTVEAVYIVTAQGKVKSVRITDATHRAFAESVRGSLRRWTFEPGKKDDKAVTSRVRQSFGFNLK